MRIANCSNLMKNFITIYLGSNLDVRDYSTNKNVKIYGVKKGKKQMLIMFYCEYSTLEIKLYENSPPQSHSVTQR